MVGLKSDSLILADRGGGRSARPAVGLTWFVLVFVSFALLVLSRLDHSYVRMVRATLANAMAPVLQAARPPLEPARWAVRQASAYFEMAESFDRLKRDNQELDHWKWRARELERQLGELSALARVAKGLATPFVSARVIASGGGAFANSVLLGVGHSHKVVAGHAVIDSGGLVGRIVDAHANSSRVLLVTDLDSRIPVSVGQSRVRALMMGVNDRRPRLGYLPDGKTIKAGDAVVTSGAGGLFPRGLRIGEVVASQGGWSVRLAARLDGLDYVSVVLHDAPALIISDGPGARAAGRRAQFQSDRRPEGTP